MLYFVAATIVVAASAAAGRAIVVAMEPWFRMLDEFDASLDEARPS